MKAARWVLSSVLAAGGMAWSAEPETARNWPQWRGPAGQGVSNETGLPLAWSATENVLWKTPIPGRGHSSPIVWGRRIFLTSAVEGDVVPGARAVRHYVEGQEFVHPDGVGADRHHQLLVMCLDAESGEILWQRAAWQGTPYDTRHRRGSFASPTPASDGSLVYAYFGSEGLYAYDFDGQLIWKASLGGLATMGVGVGSSPVLHGELLILQCDEDNGEKSFITALDKKTGQEVWRVPREVQVSWATPIVVRAGDRDELVTSGSERIVAYDPATGRELWRSQGLESNAVPSPVAGADVVVLSAGYPNKLAIAIRPGGTGDVSGSSRVLWKHAKGTAYVTSPILYDGLVYLVSDKGLVTCLDARSGELKYEGGRVPVPASFMASPVAYEGNVLLFSEDGDSYVLRAGPRHEVLRANPLGEPIHATPAVANGRLYIRTLGHLFSIGRPQTGGRDAS